MRRDAQEQSVEELVHLTRAGDLAAFDELVRRYQRQATAVSYRLLSNRDDAMEVVQDAFLKAYDRLDSLEAPGRFGSWVLRIVSNLSLNRRRARAIRKTASLDAGNPEEQTGDWTLPDPAGDTPLEVATGLDLKEQLRLAIRALPETQQQCLILFSIEKMPQKEVAALLGLSVEAVKWHVFTARKKLKEQLSDYL
jgi:RNA polymerase sigma-70 factor (ECF subfamily)